MPAPDDTKRQYPRETAIVEAEAERRLTEIKNNMPTILQRIGHERAYFGSRLYQQWKPAFDLFEVTLDICRHEGLARYNQHREKANAQKDHRFIAVSALQARACVSAAAVLTLLCHGYAHEAFTRWRTVLEIAVASDLVRRNAQGVAERYLFHADIEAAKLAEELQVQHARFGDTFYSEEQMQEFRTRRADLVAKYGKPFATQYGWAADLLQTPQPRFEDLLRAVGWENFRPLYRIASFAVHPTHRGSSFNISLPADVALQLYGPSNHGLADAGAGALEMLFMCTINFLVLHPSYETAVTMQLLKDLSEAGREEFHRIHRLLNQKPSTDNI